MINITKYLKSIKVCLFYLSCFTCFSDDIESPFEDYSPQILAEMGENAVNNIVNIGVDFFIDENGKLTEKGDGLKAILANILTQEFDKNGKKNPKFKDIDFKDLIQASVIGFSDDEQNPGTNQNINDTTVYYKEYVTDNSKPLVVWFHGHGGSYDSWTWEQKKNYNFLPNVLAIEYPSYVKNTYSTFEEIDNYTTAVAEFLKEYIEDKYPKTTNSNKKVILFSHSFGCNVNTLVYTKLKKKMNNLNLDLDLRSILIFPYYNAIDASANVLTNFKKLGINEIITPKNSAGQPIENAFDKIASKFKNKNFIIKNIVHQIYRRMFENNRKNETLNEFEYIENVSNNALVLSNGGVKLKDIRLVRRNEDHCSWNYNINLVSGKLVEILKGEKDFIVGDKDKNIIIVFSNNDEIVGKGGLLIVNHFVNEQVGHIPKKLNNNNNDILKKLYKYVDFDIKPDEINFLKNDLQKLTNFDYSVLKKIKESNSLCGCCTKIKDFENKNMDSSGSPLNGK